jgi:predicted outer membrane repeat protein
LSWDATGVGRNVVFIQNRAQKGGGAVHVDANTTLALVNADMRGNNASWGGAVSVSEQAQVALWGSNLTNNTAAQGGGAMNVIVSGRVLLTDTQGFGNTAARWGGFINLEGYAQAVIANSAFDCNAVQPNRDEPSGQGGFMHAVDNADIAVGNTTIKGHVKQSWVEGGAIILNKYARLSLSSSEISHFHTRSRGGAISVHDNSFLYAYNTTLASTSSLLAGGGLYVGLECSKIAPKSGCVVSFESSRFVNTTSLGGGGGMMVSGGDVSLVDTIFERCRADMGGA